jgi:hypothetical protein
LKRCKRICFLQGKDSNEDREDGSATLGSEGAGVVGVARAGSLGDRRSSAVTGRDRGGGGLGGGGLGSRRGLGGHGGLSSGRGLGGGSGLSRRGGLGSGLSGLRGRFTGAGTLGVRDLALGAGVGNLALGHGVGVKLALRGLVALAGVLNTVGEGLLEVLLAAQAAGNLIYFADVAAGRSDVRQGARLGARWDDIEGASSLRGREGGGDEDGNEGDGVLHFDGFWVVVEEKREALYLFLS